MNTTPTRAAAPEIDIETIASAGFAELEPGGNPHLGMLFKTTTDAWKEALANGSIHDQRRWQTAMVAVQILAERSLRESR